VNQLAATIRQGVADGQIRPDVGTDFKNTMQPAMATLAAGKPSSVPQLVTYVSQLVTTLRSKLQTRLNEQSVKPAEGPVLAAQINQLQATVTG
jgi:hypothetical protein